MSKFSCGLRLCDVATSESWLESRCWLDRFGRSGGPRNAGKWRKRETAEKTATNVGGNYNRRRLAIYAPNHLRNTRRKGCDNATNGMPITIVRTDRAQSASLADSKIWGDGKRDDLLYRYLDSA